MKNTMETTELTVTVPLQTQQTLDKLASSVNMDRDTLASSIIIAAFACGRHLDATTRKALPAPAPATK